jgi:dsDNA-binding SOS-regulon protein/uncharacterized protein (DUF983 family)
MTTVQTIRPVRVLQTYKSPVKTIKEEEPSVASITTLPGSLPRAQAKTQNQECSCTAAEEANRLYTDAKSETSDEKLEKEELLQTDLKRALFKLTQEKARLLRLFLAKCQDVLRRDGKKALPDYARRRLCWLLGCKDSELDAYLLKNGMPCFQGLFQPDNRTGSMLLTIPTKSGILCLGFAYCPSCEKMSVFDQKAWDSHCCHCSECGSDFSFLRAGSKHIDIAPGIQIAATSFVDQVYEKKFGKQFQVTGHALSPPGFIQRAAEEIGLFEALDRIECKWENHEYTYRIERKKL